MSRRISVNVTITSLKRVGRLMGKSATASLEVPLSWRTRVGADRDLVKSADNN
jgi:hypothetical protein